MMTWHLWLVEDMPAVPCIKTIKVCCDIAKLNLVDDPVPSFFGTSAVTKKCDEEVLPKALETDWGMVARWGCFSLLVKFDSHVERRHHLR